LQLQHPRDPVAELVLAGAGKKLKLKFFESADLERVIQLLLSENGSSC